MFLFLLFKLSSTITHFIDNFITYIVKLYFKQLLLHRNNFEQSGIISIDFSSKPLSLLRASPAATFSKKLNLSKRDKIPWEAIIHVDKARSPSRRRGVCCTLGRERGVCACARSEVSPLSFSRSPRALLDPRLVPRSRWKWAHSMATATTPDQHTLGLDPLLGSLRDHGENVAERCRSAGECCARRRGGRSSLGNSPLQSHARLAPSWSRTGFLFAPRPPGRCSRLGPLSSPIYIYDFLR